MLGLLVERFVPYSLVCLGPGGGFPFCFCFSFGLLLDGDGVFYVCVHEGEILQFLGCLLQGGSVCVLVVLYFLISVLTLGGRVCVP